MYTIVAKRNGNWEDVYPEITWRLQSAVNLATNLQKAVDESPLSRNPKTQYGAKNESGDLVLVTVSIRS